MKLLILTVSMSLATILFLLASHGTSANGELLRQACLMLSAGVLGFAVAEIVKKVRNPPRD